MGDSLTGKVVMVPESRELDLFAGMLEQEGAVTRRCPLVAIQDLDEMAPLDVWLRDLTASGVDDLVLMTGEGLRRILARAEAIGLRETAIAVIGRARKITRGPKPTRALREIGLAPDIAAAVPTTEGVVASLAALDLKGHSIGLQCYPGQTGVLPDHMRAAGAVVFAVTPYRYASHAETEQVAAAIRTLADGTIDVIAITSSPQIERLMTVAKERGLEAELRRGLDRVRIASVGPIVTERLRELGFEPAMQPDTFHLKPLIKAIASGLT